MVELDPDDGVLGLLDVIGDHLVELRDPLNTVYNPASCEHRAFLIDDADIVMLFGPVHADEDQTFRAAHRRNLEISFAKAQIGARFCLTPSSELQV